MHQAGISALTWLLAGIVVGVILASMIAAFSYGYEQLRWRCEKCALNKQVVNRNQCLYQEPLAHWDGGRIGDNFNETRL